jgi:hypothetical protein
MGNSVDCWQTALGQVSLVSATFGSFDHLNPETYQSLREDSLAALHRLNAIIA